MSNYVFVSPGGMQPLASPSTVQQHPLGYRAGAVDPTLGYAEFQYVQGSTNAAGLPVFIKGNTALALASATNFGSAGPVGIAPAALSATNVYGWAQVYGLCDFAVINASAPVGAMLIAGSVLASGLGTVAAGSANVANQVRNIAVASSQSASSAAGVVFLNYPFVCGV
jgi:hypothetical protein